MTIVAMETVGSRVRHIRKSKGISRTDLSAQSGVGYSTLAELERGGMQTSTKLRLIADALGVSLAWLETGKGSPERALAQPSQAVGLDAGRLSLMIECLEGALLDAKRELDPSRKARILALLYADPGVGNTREAVQAALRVAFMAMG